MSKILYLGAGARIPGDIIAMATREGVYTALLTGIGGVSEVRLAYFNRKTKKYEEHTYMEDLAVTGLIGNITTLEEKPFVHVHGTFGGRGASIVGGHVVSATVSPRLELVLTPTKNRALRRFDDEVGLNVIYKS